MSTTFNTIDWVETERITGENDPNGYPDIFNRACKQLWALFCVEHDKDGDHKSDLLAQFLQIEEGTYTGDGVDPHNVTLTDTNLIPLFVCVFVDDTVPVHFRLKEAVMAGDASKQMQNIAFEADVIQSTTTGGFQVGGDPDVNTDTIEYHYIVFGTYG